MIWCAVRQSMFDRTDGEMPFLVWGVGLTALRVRDYRLRVTGKRLGAQPVQGARARWMFAEYTGRLTGILVEVP